MSKQHGSYVQILRATSIFGAVQVVNVLISVLKSKAVSILLGPFGMGTIGLFTSTLNTVSEITKVGLGTSAVKEISLTRNLSLTKLLRTIASLRKLIIFTGLLGVILMIALSPLLSQLTFGNEDYVVPIIWLSLALFFKQLTSSEQAVLQGVRSLNSLAKANVFASLAGLLISIPLYYFFEEKAIVPVIIIVAFTAYVISKFYSSKLKYKHKRISTKEAFKEGRQMLELGVVFGLRGLMTVLVAYLLNIFISNYGSVKEVGFFTAGFTILNTYVGMVFNAMQTDYYPRLSADILDLGKASKLVNEQALVALLLLGPIVVLFISFAPLFVKILFSKEFVVIVGFVSVGILGVILKSASWSMGYVILAKGNSGLFLKLGVLFNTLWLAIHALGYYYWGLLGIGIGFLVYYVLHFVIIGLLVKNLYSIHMNKEFMKVFIFTLVLGFAAYGCTFMNNLFFKYSLLSSMVIVSFIFTFITLNRKVNIKNSVLMFIKRKRNKTQ